MSTIKLTSFQIHSYRSCINTKLILQDELSALIGVNGAGKSNILSGLQFLSKILSGHELYAPHFDKENILKSCLIKAEFDYNGKKIFLRSRVKYSTDEKNNDDVNYHETHLNLKEFTKKDRWIDLNDPFMYKSYNYRSFNDYRHNLTNLFRVSGELKKGRIRELFVKYSTAELKIIETVNYQLVQFIRNISYYSASQFSDPSQCPVAIELGESRITGKATPNKSHEKFILDLYKSYKENDSQYKRYLSIINKEGIGLIDTIKFIEVKMPSSSYTIKGGVSVKTIKKERILIVPVFTVDKNKLSPNQLSEGTFKTIALLFYLLTDENKILLIEEPEVCVHHGLLNSIITLIKQEAVNKQIIISTHSDYVLDLLKPENIILVRKTDSGTKAELLRSILSKNAYSVLKKYLNTTGNLGEYLKEGGI